MKLEILICKIEEYLNKCKLVEIRESAGVEYNTKIKYSKDKKQEPKNKRKQ